MSQNFRSMWYKSSLFTVVLCLLLILLFSFIRQEVVQTQTDKRFISCGEIIIQADELAVKVIKQADVKSPLTDFERETFFFKKRQMFYTETLLNIFKIEKENVGDGEVENLSSFNALYDDLCKFSEVYLSKASKN